MGSVLLGATADVLCRGVRKFDEEANRCGDERCIEEEIKEFVEGAEKKLPTGQDITGDPVALAGAVFAEALNTASSEDLLKLCPMVKAAKPTESSLEDEDEEGEEEFVDTPVDSVD